MATKTLRPSAATTTGHTLSSGSNAATLLSETTSDGDSTYIYQSISSTSSASKTTTVSFGALFDSVNYNVTACRLYFVARDGNSSATTSASVTFKVAGSGSYAVSASSLGTSYTSYNASNANMVSAINTALRGGSVPAITADIKTTGNLSSSKDSSTYVRVTQVYLEVDYEAINVPTSTTYIKTNGTWKQYTQTYKKVNGAWVLQTNTGVAIDPNINYVRGD